MSQAWGAGAVAVEGAPEARGEKHSITCLPREESRWMGSRAELGVSEVVFFGHVQGVMDARAHSLAPSSPTAVQ